MPLPFLLTLCALTGVGQESAVDFVRDVQPILRAKCHACHDAGYAEGGLRLDTRRHAERGGYSGGVILGGPLDRNELWKRVSSKDEDFRMPYTDPPLTEGELGVIRRWIEAGSPWEHETGANGVVEPYTGRPTDGSLGESASLVDGVRVVGRILRGQATLLLTLLVLFYLTVRARARVKRATPTEASAPGLLTSIAARANASIFVAILAFFCFAGLIAQNATLVREADELFEEARLNTQVKTIQTLYGRPPVPFRPDQPKSLASTYYRGNCERGPGLFNGGAYRTATLRVSLCDTRREPVAVGDPVPADGYLLRLSIERAANTAPSMFDYQKMDAVFLSEETFGKPVSEVVGDITLLETLERDQRWEAYYPVEVGESGKRGMVYVYTNRRSDGRKFMPIPHYGLKYELLVEDGVLSAASDVWLGTLFWTDRLEYPQPEGRRPMHEWFNTEPGSLPEIPDDDEHHRMRREAAGPERG